MVKDIKELASNKFDDILKELVDEIKQHEIFSKINDLKTIKKQNYGIR